MALELSKKHQVSVYAREIEPATPDYTVQMDSKNGIPIRWVNYGVRDAWNDASQAYVNQTIASDFKNCMGDVKPDIVHIAHTAWLSTSIVEIAKAERVPTALQLNDFYYMCTRIHLYHVDGHLCGGPETGEKCRRCISHEIRPHLERSAQKNFGRGAAKNAGVERTEYMKKLLQLPDLLLSPSGFIKQKYVEFGVPEPRIIVSPYGIEPFQVQATTSSKFRFGFLGHMFVHKGPKGLIEAFRGMDQASNELRMYGIGESNFVAKLKERSREKSIVFMNAFDHATLPEILSSLDVVVVPSTCHESYSFVAREALMAGRPVIVSDIQAQSEAVLEEVNGLHFNHRDVRDLRKKMVRLSTDRQLYNRLASGATHTKQTTIQEEASSLESQYASLLQTNNRR